MKRDWWERAIAGMADAGTLFGMPPASVELMILEQHEREELARQRAAEQAAGIPHPSTDDDDDGDGGSRRHREPVAA